MAKRYTSIPRNWLVWEWLLDGSAIDTNDWTKNNWNASNVTYTNTTVGYQKQTGVFNGSSSIVNIPYSSQLDITWSNATLTMSFWINTSDNSWYIGWFTNGNNANWFWLWMNIWVGGSAWNISIYDWNWIPTWININDSKWHHIIWTKNGATNTIYKNLVSVFSNWWGWTITSDSTNKHLMNCDNLWFYTSWLLQTFRLYNRTLSKLEITSLYHEWLRKLWGWSDDILSSCVAQFENYWDNNLENISTWYIATRTWWASTTDNFWIAKAITNPNYSWTSITYTAWYTFENDWTWWAIKTNPTWLSATWINRTTTLWKVLLFSRTLSADEVTVLQNLCNKKYLYPFRKTLPSNLK